jgi:hypothetical protein
MGARPRRLRRAFPQSLCLLFLWLSLAVAGLWSPVVSGARGKSPSYVGALPICGSFAVDFHYDVVKNHGSTAYDSSSNVAVRYDGARMLSASEGQAASEGVRPSFSGFGRFLAAKEGPTLFRGTSAGYPGNPSLQRIGVTPTSTDPVVATLFGTESEAFGQGVVHIATPGSLEGVEIIEGNVLRGLESEVGVGLRPAEFAGRADITITSGQARQILSEMGIDVPTQIGGKAGLDTALRSTPRLTPAQIQEFVNRARALK